MAGDRYASGSWHVQAGTEDEFITRWQAFITESAKAGPRFQLGTAPAGRR